MMHRKFMILLCVAFSLVLLVTTAFAVEGETDATSEPEAAAEGSETIQTVNVSDESVSAIAEAVSRAAPSTSPNFYVTNKLGVDVPVWGTLTAGYWADYEYHIVLYDTTNLRYSYACSDAPILVGSRNYPSVYFMTATNLFLTQFMTSTSREYRLGPATITSGSVYEQTLNLTEGDDPSSLIVYADYDVGLYDGGVYLDEVVYTSDIVPAYVISFETGFDDLVIEDQTTDTLCVEDPYYSGRIFLGWYLDSEYTTPYTSDYEFTADTTLYAKWSELGEMAFFTGSILSSLSVILNVEPILYVVSLMALLVIIGIIRKFVLSRV